MASNGGEPEGLTDYIPVQTQTYTLSPSTTTTLNDMYRRIYSAPAIRTYTANWIWDEEKAPSPKATEPEFNEWGEIAP